MLHEIRKIPAHGELGRIAVASAVTTGVNNETKRLFPLQDPTCDFLEAVANFKDYGLDGVGFSLAHTDATPFLQVGFLWTDYLNRLDARALMYVLEAPYDQYKAAVAEVSSRGLDTVMADNIRSWEFMSRQFYSTNQGLVIPLACAELKLQRS